jgi:hypothetical protein
MNMQTQVYDVETQEISERDVTPAELDVMRQDQEYAQSKISDLQNSNNSKTVAEAKLAKLGLTVEDLKALL